MLLFACLPSCYGDEMAHVLQRVNRGESDTRLTVDKTEIFS